MPRSKLFEPKPHAERIVATYEARCGQYSNEWLKSRKMYHVQEFRDKYKAVETWRLLGQKKICKDEELRKIHQSIWEGDLDYELIRNL